jgi:hypothetical protein
MGIPLEVVTVVTTREEFSRSKRKEQVMELCKTDYNEKGG